MCNNRRVINIMDALSVDYWKRGSPKESQIITPCYVFEDDKCLQLRIDLRRLSYFISVRKDNKL